MTNVPVDYVSPTYASLPLPQKQQQQQCKSHGVTKCVADPDHLFRVKCTKCDFVRDYSQNGSGAAKYLYHRRRTRAAQGLLSVGAPLDGVSAAFLCRTSSECGIISNTTQPHVSFVEGLVPEIDHTAAVRHLRDSLFHNPTLTVVSVHRVPRRDNVTDLVLADVVLNPGADAAARTLADGRLCKLPQFPFHVALGACPTAGGASKRAAAWAEARLRGVTLAVDPSRVRVLPPPEGSKKGPRHPGKSGGAHRGQYSHQQLQQQQHQHPQRQGQYQPQQQRQPKRLYHQEHNNGAFNAASAVVTNGYVHMESMSGCSEPETDETDAASTSTSSSASEEQQAQFPGLAVDLTFLD